MVMIRIGLFILFIFTSLGGYAAPNSYLFVNPYYPEFNQENDELSRALMDAALENEITQYNQRRERLQSLMIEYTPDYAGLLQKDAFVMKRLMDRGTRRAFHSPWIKKSSVGRFAENVKNNLQTDVRYQDSKNIEHKFDFKIAAFQGQAFIQYAGVTKAQLRYDIDNGGSLAMIFQHDLTDLSSIGIETTLTGEYRTQSVLLNIYW